MAPKRTRYVQLQQAAAELLNELQTREGHLLEAQGTLQRATMELEARVRSVYHRHNVYHAFSGLAVLQTAAALVDAHE